MKACFCKRHFPDLVRILNGYVGKITDEPETSVVLFQEKDVMLALEEYWHIVEASPLCNALNSRMVSMIINPDAYAASDVIDLHLEDGILEKSIADYFGCKKYTDAYKFQKRLLQNGMESLQRREFLIHIISECIYYVFRFRKNMDQAAPVFEMPAQSLKILVEDEREKDAVEPLDLMMDVRKYVPFHLHLSQCFLGQDNLALDIDGMINYYYWCPTIHVRIPYDYPNRRGIINLYDDLRQYPLK